MWRETVARHRYGGSAISRDYRARVLVGSLPQLHNAVLRAKAAAVRAGRCPVAVILPPDDMALLHEEDRRSARTPIGGWRVGGLPVVEGERRAIRCGEGQVDAETKAWAERVGRG